MIDISLVDESEIAMIKNWLTLTKTAKNNYCPFTGECLDGKRHFLICKMLFPRIELFQLNHRLTAQCPCYHYSLGYVTQKAKRLLQIWKTGRI